MKKLLFIAFIISLSIQANPINSDRGTIKYYANHFACAFAAGLVGGLFKANAYKIMNDQTAPAIKFASSAAIELGTLGIAYGFDKEVRIKYITHPDDNRNDTIGIFLSKDPKISLAIFSGSILGGYVAGTLISEKNRRS